MPIFKALHILAMFGAVAMLVGEALFYGIAIRRRDVHALAAIRRVTGRRPILGVAFLGSGILFGLLTALTGSFDLLEGWLIAAYALVLAMFAFNATPWVMPRGGRVLRGAPGESVEAASGFDHGPPSPVSSRSSPGPAAGPGLRSGVAQW